MDWNAIKTEYITDESTSYRKLAEKYGVPLGTIFKRAKRENWIGLRQQSQDKMVAKTVAKIENAQIDRLTRIHSITDKALDKLEYALDNVDALDTSAFRQIIASIKDIKEIQMLRSAVDLREQEARIRNLERQAEGDDRNLNAVTVTIEGGDDSWRQ